MKHLQVRLVNYAGLCVPLVLIGVILFSSSVLANFSFQEAKDRVSEVFPEDYNDWSDAQRLDWLQASIRDATQEIDRYILQRNLFVHFFVAQNYEKASALCETNKPLQMDYIYRLGCIEANANFAAHDNNEVIQKLADLTVDAKRNGEIEYAIHAMSMAGWLHSEAGEVSQALAAYEEAMSLVPEGNEDLLYRLKFNSATIYIVHGNEEWVKKGISLLEDIIRSNSQYLENTNANPLPYKMKIEMATFNQGIAYVLHLYDYEQALQKFLKVMQFDLDHVRDAAIFAALSSAVLGRHEAAKLYLAKASKMSSTDKIKEIYLRCYKQLTIRHWSPASDISACLNLHPNTTMEVQVDVIKRLAKLKGSREELVALRQLYELFIKKIEPELKNRSSKKASSTELKRLQIESNLRGKIIDQERLLKELELNQQSSNQQFLITLTVVLGIAMGLMLLQFQQKRKLVKQFELLSYHDPLTKLRNRRYLEEHIVREVEVVLRQRTREPGSCLAIFLVDLDHFKKINDNYGHGIGDDILIQFAERISKITRDSDIFSRWGGEEFILVARLKSEEEMFDLAERIRTTVADIGFDIDEPNPLKVTCTLGGVSFPFVTDDNLMHDWQGYFSLADLALYWGKMTQRNSWVIVKNSKLLRNGDIQTILGDNFKPAVEDGTVRLKASYHQEGGITI